MTGAGLIENWKRRSRRTIARGRVARCDGCGKRRPLWWARQVWWKLGGVAGYFDLCSKRCEDSLW